MVGVLARDHPEPNTTRRHVNQPEESEAALAAPVVTETDDVPTKSKHRKAGRPIYLSLTLNMEQGWYRWLWRDQGRQRINTKYVTYNSGLDSAKACERVINHFDRREKARISAWNREVTTFLARRRIVEWVTDGSASGRHVDANDRLGPGVIQKLVLASAFVGQGMSRVTGLAPEPLKPGLSPSILCGSLREETPAAHGTPVPPSPLRELHDEAHAMKVLPASTFLSFSFLTDPFFSNQIFYSLADV
ncbi:uncharacterized protein NECHADRAFT_77438 [Fusarium vanettenii 77-13-4]|uniref:Uncharacterized protein n=1 Tax=Fusarium vanettenii (strain ATCC MYA-4622 / CBS 123669 / FGSC 9596 / NRRL 45880 / 77-13-4) TaxID=660122 RepID=C7YL82_FUSV7|nr:uncharacterized protein NECHADRAFT_77438 [Fusarium vanettenii 77-13-4]EEU46743.1 hypothetical protein NECHADRAFT_77438 [Fusarium vanettenii 77-13-4]